MVEYATSFFTVSSMGGFCATGYSHRGLGNNSWPLVIYSSREDLLDIPYLDTQSRLDILRTERQYPDFLTAGLMGTTRQCPAQPGQGYGLGVVQCRDGKD